MQTRHISCAIHADPQAVYNVIANPFNLPSWAAGLAQANVEQEGDDLLVDSPMGPVRVRFVPRNPHLVADHEVTLPTGIIVNNPLRVLSHPHGCEVVFSVRQLELSDEEYAQDCAMVEKDLHTLKALCEG